MSADINLEKAAPPWFDYPLRVQPHHTDYAGIVWHGTYLAWLEEARVECLRSVGVAFADLVALGVDLPVVDLGVRYRRAIALGESVLVRVRTGPNQGVRLVWDCQICLSPDQICATAQVILAPVDRQRGRILRQLPDSLQAAIARLQAGQYRPA